MKKATRNKYKTKNFPNNKQFRLSPKMTSEIVEDQPEAMNDREKWREGVLDIRASGTT